MSPCFCSTYAMYLLWICLSYCSYNFALVLQVMWQFYTFTQNYEKWGLTLQFFSPNFRKRGSKFFSRLKKGGAIPRSLPTNLIYGVSHSTPTPAPGIGNKGSQLVYKRQHDINTRMWNMISSPATPTVCVEQKSENFQSRNVTLSIPSQSQK